jgi:hypothetical protein
VNPYLYKRVLPRAEAYQVGTSRVRQWAPLVAQPVPDVTAEAVGATTGRSLV